MIFRYFNAAGADPNGELGWQPRYPELSSILSHAWAWHQTLISH